MEKRKNNFQSDSLTDALTIQPLTLEDLDDLAQMEKRCFADAWSQDDLRFELEKNPYSHGIALKQNGRLAGYAFLWIMFESAQLANIAVDPQLRHRGYGKYLLKEVISQAEAAGCETITLEVRRSNAAAIHLYQNAGFQLLREVLKYYGDEDALLMGMGI